jgi:thiamine-monophosphate kinase
MPDEQKGSRPLFSVGEHALIERIHARLPPPNASVIIGIGDDAAVVEPERNALEVLTTDSQVEGIHFDFAFVDPSDVGHRALAVNLSDIAAMGASPRVALLIDITVMGSVHRRRVLTRSGARPGDDLYVTGSIGGAAAALRLLRNETTRSSPAASAVAVRYRRPEPRLRFGVLLGRNRAARACIDLSDGLADGVRQLGRASGVGAVIDATALPIDKGATLEEALSGGEDYELLFASAPKLRRRLEGVCRHVKDVAVTRIGRTTREGTFLLEKGGKTETLPEGFAHFGS